MYRAKYLPEFDVLYRSVLMTGRLVTRAPLHIGTGETGGKPTGIESPLIKMRVGDEERVYIPGSSVKGVIRSAVENALKSKKLQYACDPFSGEKNPDCESCALFGSTERASVVQIEDLILSEPIHTESRTGIGIDRDTGAVHRGALFTFEAIPPGTVFPFVAHFENPANYQLGLFAIGVRALDSGLVRLGGMKSRGLGKVQLKIDGIEFHFPFGRIEGPRITRQGKILAEIRGGELVVYPIREGSDVQVGVEGAPSLDPNDLGGVARLEKPQLAKLIEAVERVL
jgi:CRISPR/Cas system CSM-associated protein Csm3 (group 7 of RAMP superfamily)